MSDNTINNDQLPYTPWYTVPVYPLYTGTSVTPRYLPGGKLATTTRTVDGRGADGLSPAKD